MLHCERDHYYAVLPEIVADVIKRGGSIFWQTQMTQTPASGSNAAVCLDDPAIAAISEAVTHKGVVHLFLVLSAIALG